MYVLIVWITENTEDAEDAEILACAVFIASGDEGFFTEQLSTYFRALL